MIKTDLPIWLVKIIEKLMNKNPDERYQTAREVIDDIKKYKEKNYENVIISSESEYNLEDLSKANKNPAILKPVEPKKTENIISNIEIKETKPDASNRAQNDKEKEAVPENIYGSDKTHQKKLQSPSLYKLIRTTYHFFYSFIAIIFLLIFMLMNSSQNYYTFLSSFISKPYSIIFFIAGLFFIYLTIKSLNIKSIITYIFITSLMLVTVALIPLTMDKSIPSLIDRFLYLLRDAGINSVNIFILSFITAIAAQKVPHTELRLSKIISSILLLLSIFMLQTSLMSLFSVNTYNVFFYASIILAGIYSLLFIFHFKKNMIFFIYIVASLILLFEYKDTYINNSLQKTYETEMSAYRQTKEKMILKIQENFYTNLNNQNNSTLNYSDLEENLKKEINNQLATLKEPDKNLIKDDISKDYFKNLKDNLYAYYLKSLFLAIVLLWLLMNYIFVTDLFKKDPYEM
jgi:hypothetical protein